MDKMKKYYLLLGIIAFFIVLIADLHTDLRAGENIDHKRGAILRGIGLLFSLIPLTLYSKGKGVNILLAGFLSCLLIGFNYLNFFDGFYNIFRDHPWFFTGSEDGDADAVTDNFFQSIPLWLHATIKLVGSIASILLYYLFTFKNKKHA